MHLGRPPERDTIQSVVRYQAHLGDEASPTDKPLTVASPACKARRTPNGMPYPSGDNFPKNGIVTLLTPRRVSPSSLRNLDRILAFFRGKQKSFFGTALSVAPGNDVQSMNKN